LSVISRDKLNRPNNLVLLPNSHLLIKTHFLNQESSKTLHRHALISLLRYVLDCIISDRVSLTEWNVLDNIHRCLFTLLIHWKDNLFRTLSIFQVKVIFVLLWIVLNCVYKFKVSQNNLLNQWISTKSSFPNPFTSTAKLLSLFNLHIQNS